MQFDEKIKRIENQFPTVKRVLTTLVGFKGKSQNAPACGLG
jgi:hypothetical protein